MDLKEIQLRNYNATKRRGLITPNTTELEFLYKLYEEVTEFEFEIAFTNDNKKPLELADIIIVCICYAKHFNIDIQKALEQKTLINEKRKD